VAVAVITGGGRGLGAAIAHRLAAGGWSVAIAGRSRDSLRSSLTSLARHGPTCVAIDADVTKKDDVDRIFDVAERSLGDVDLLVNNAGVTEHGPIWETDPATWWRVVETNLLGPFLCSRAALIRMIPRRAGRIVNIGSYVGNRANPIQTAYATSKAALLRFTDSLAEQTCDLGIRVFAVSPGALDTDMGRDVRRWNNQPSPEYVLPTAAADLIAELASGRFDALAGRLLHIADDPNELLANLDEIQQRNLYQLSFAKLNSEGAR
jgi:3-oxoacyl-[acyl-carrier protein] reductase